MYSKTILALTILLVLVSVINAKTVTIGKPKFEMDDENASAYLHSALGEHPGHMFKREFGRNCVPCKFGLNPCCEPNICKKNRIFPNECLEIKVPRSD